MAPRRLRRADMHLEQVPLAELAGTGARAKGESHRLCIFANANMVATPQQACAYHHDSRLRGGDAAHGRGVHAGRERLSGREGSGKHQQTEERHFPVIDCNVQKQSAIPMELKNGRYTNRVRRLSPEKTPA